MARRARFSRKAKAKAASERVNGIQYAYTLIVEWDGNKPPMSWYNRLHEYGLHVRGSKDATPLARRFHKSHEGWGVIAQEGILLVETEALMQQLSKWATHYGALNVMQGRLHIEAAALSESDELALNNLVHNVTKTGPKRIAEEGNYVITCLDEGKTFEEELDSQPVSCPKCQSHRFQARLGKRAEFLSVKYKPADMTIYSYWLSTRFSQRMFEIPKVITSFAEGNELPEVPPEDVAPVKLPSLVPNIKFTNADGTMKSEEEQLHLYDVLYILSQMGKTKRVDGRLRVLEAYWRANGANAYVMGVMNENVVDTIDLSIVDREFTKYL